MREEVLNYLSGFTDLPIQSFVDDFDLVSDINWDDMHEDESFETLIDDFIFRFQIYVPQQDFREFARSKNIPLILYPFSYVLYVLKIRKPLELYSLTVKELISIAESRRWPN